MTGPLIATSLYELRPEYPYLFTCALLGLVAVAVTSPNANTAPIHLN
jgi:hypothetical protein